MAAFGAISLSWERSKAARLATKRRLVLACAETSKHQKEASPGLHYRSPVPEIHTLAPEAGAGGPPCEMPRPLTNSAPAPAAIGLCSRCVAQESLWLRLITERALLAIA